MVYFLINVVHEFVRNNFKEVEIVMGWFLRFVFEIIIDFVIFLKHVENSVFTMIKLSKSVDNNLLLTLVTKGNFIDNMIHLKLIPFFFLSIKIGFQKFSISLSIAFLSEWKLSCNFRNV